MTTNSLQLLFIHQIEGDSTNGFQNINLGGPIRLHYKQEMHKINIYYDEKYIKGFYQNINNEGIISNISAIVGKNGVGKTRLMQYIANTIGTTKPTSIFVTAFLQNEIEILIYSNSDHDYKIEVNNSIPSEYSISSLKFNNRTSSLFDDLRTIYYKNYLEPNHDILNYTNIDDLSLESFIINNEQDYFNDGNSNNINTTKHSIISSIVNKIKLKEIELQLYFLNSDIKYDDKLFNKPSSIRLNIRTNHKDKLFKLITNTKINKYLNDIIENIDKMEAIYKSLFSKLKSSEHKAKYTLIYNAIVDHYVEFIIRYGRIGYYIDIKLPAKYRNITEFSNDIIQQLNLNLSKNTNLVPLTLNMEFINLINNMSYSFAFKNIDYKENFNELSLEINNNHVILTELVRTYYDFIIYDGFILFEFNPSLSAGESSLINLFAKLYTVSHSLKFETTQNLIILIDEGENGLHPDWQRMYIYNLIKYIPKLFAKNRDDNQINIQIILSTHSPFVLSDLTLSNIIFFPQNNNIDRNNYYYFNNNNNTFGANIHTLLSDSFFMDNGLIGEFAKHKLNEVIHELTSTKEIKLEKQKYIYKIIQMTGEPIIRNKLMSLYKQKFDLELSKRVKRLEDKLGLDD